MSCFDFTKNSTINHIVFKNFQNDIYWPVASEKNNNDAQTKSLINFLKKGDAFIFYMYVHWLYFETM